MTDREKLIALIFNGQRLCTNSLCHGCKQLADHLIANGVVVREKGEWERVDHDGSWRVDKCSICHRRIHYVDYDQPYPFCPNCGADMRKGENG